VRFVAPPNALLASTNVPLHVPGRFEAMTAQTFVKSIVRPPIGAGALILLPPSAALLK
jgi:hypothetical protein